METVTVTLSEFLLARIAEDEAKAREDYANGMTGRLWKHYPEDAYEEVQRLTLDRGRRLAAECEAKRRIIYYMQGPVVGTVGELAQATRIHERVLQFLAQPYADHPDFRDEWRA